jgi:hypothetical protein
MFNTGEPATMIMAKTRRRWTRPIIFISLYLLLSLSLAEGVITSYLFALKSIHTTMLLGLIPGLIAVRFSSGLLLMALTDYWPNSRSLLCLSSLYILFFPGSIKTFADSAFQGLGYKWLVVSYPR